MSRGLLGGAGGREVVGRGGGVFGGGVFGVGREPLTARSSLGVSVAAEVMDIAGGEGVYETNWGGYHRMNGGEDGEAPD